MGKKLIKGQWHSFPIPCLICGVDSWPIKLFLGVFIGSLVVASISFIVWGWVTGRYGKDEESASMAIEADARE
ncbi:MAG: hypothetical protein H6617_03065 [Bdellovibrionaceae bacterium]|nr:hypothetical protein [Bdellovibrionales bacterium]MCB9253640.1 hypothetical protein [Pseudobdellovibrionaceae bacterium]